MSRARICIITPGQLGSNPRVVKEAGALSEAGYEVTVIATRVLASVEERDRSILESAPWRTQRIPFDNAARRKMLRLVQEATVATRRFISSSARRDARAYSVMAPALIRAALRERADLYIAHYVAALPAAALAAQHYGARYAFDAEDYHAGELGDGPEVDRQRSLVEAIESRHLQGCCYVSAASPGIASAYAESYGIAHPAVLLNVFPRSQAPAKTTPHGNAELRPSLYWFSQTIGPGRGLECAVQALAHTRSRPTLYLRGHIAAGFDSLLKRLASDCGVVDRVVILPPDLPERMELLASAYDLGLCGEPPVTHNRSVALSNKLFSYLLAGVPVVAAAIPSHLALSGQLGNAMSIFQPEVPCDLARAIDSLLLHPDRLAASRAQAWHLGQSRFCWDAEKETLLALVAQALKADRSAAA